MEINGDHVKLETWGRIIGFQKKLIDEVNSLVIEHHRKTLSNAHTGSIYRTTIFLLMELFCEYFYKIIDEYFQIPLRINSLEIRIKSNVGDVIKSGFSREPSEEGFTIDDLNLEDEIRNIKKEYIEIDLDYRITLPDDMKEIVKRCFIQIMPIMHQAVALIEKECIEIAQSNQNVREDILKSSHEVFEKHSAYQTFFKELILNVSKRYKEAQNTSYEKVAFQIMLFLPIIIKNEGNYSNDTSETGSKGIFFYPYFHLLENKQINNGTTAAGEDLIKLRLASLMDKIFYKTDIREKEVTMQNSLNIFKSFSGREHPENHKIFDKFVRFLFNDNLTHKLLCDHMVSNGDIITDYDYWKPDNISALLSIFDRFRKLSENANDTEIERHFVDQLIVKSDVLDHCFQKVMGKITSEIIKNSQVEIALWENIVDSDELHVFQPAGKGVVGDIVKDFLALRIRDQKYVSLTFPGRIGIQYNVMGFLEGRYGHGGGDFPVALIPLTANGQLLGSFYAVKKKEKSRFTTNEMNTMEFLATYIAQSIQEAKDTYVFKRLKFIPDLDDIGNRREVIATFVSSAAIVTNIEKVKIERVENLDDIEEETWRDKLRRTKTPRLERDRNKINQWHFIIPPQIWNEKSIKDEYWTIRLKYFEPTDIIANYKNEIEKLYRTILHALGLKASGSEINVDILEVLGLFHEMPEIQKQFSGAKITPKRDYTKDFLSDYDKISWERWSCVKGDCQIYDSINPLDNNAGPVGKSGGQNSNELLVCLECWWINAADNKNKKAKIRALFYLMTKTLSVPNAIKRLKEEIFY